MIGGMKIKALAPWFGGKRTMAPAIVQELGKHTQYFEPFCGSMAVLFAKEPSQKETVNDLHGDLINLARVVQDPVMAPALYERLQSVLFCEAILEDARDYLSAHDEHPYDSTCPVRAYWYFLASWMGLGGTVGTERADYQLAVRFTKGGGSPTVRFRNVIDSIPAWHSRLKNVVILRRDAFEILDRFEDVPGTSIYSDQPYLPETRSQGAYLHEFSDGAALFGGNDDHRRLADIWRDYDLARIVVSSYDCARIRELYDGWTFIDHGRQKNMHRQNGRKTEPGEAPEVLIINGASYAGASETQEPCHAET